MTSDLWMLRPAIESDRHFILDTWYRAHPPLFRGVSGRVYFNGQSRLIKRLYDQCAAYVACYAGDSDLVLGWSVTSASAVHYVWVREDFRRQGIARALLTPYIGKPTIYTHPPNRAYIRDLIPKDWVYDPYLAFDLAETRTGEERTRS